MKAIKQIRASFTFFLIYVLIMSTSVSCTDKEEVKTGANSVNQKMIETILVEMKTLGDAQGKIIEFDVKNISKKDYRNHFEILKNSKKILDFASGSSEKRKEDNYTVTCTWGNGTTKVTECGSNVGCAGQATWDCLENGGCATICNAKITYTPAIIKVDENDKIKEIERVLEQVMEISNSRNEAISFSIAYNNEKYWLGKVSTIKNTDNYNLTARATYQVDCYNSDGELLWQDTYYDKLSASNGILDCTDRDGGCAEICEIYARYYPKGKTK